MVDFPAAKAIMAAAEELVPVEERQGVPMRAVRAVVAHLHLDATPGALATFNYWDRRTPRADVIEALESAATALDGREAES
ncbi:hypothetical protein ACQEVF_34195 [Nonomuraea polychroma]|uniref:hypothetical protein n=1 Tax=Nonomuraea polychroma TaxID=46176 RepID=UPI003D8FC498